MLPTLAELEAQAPGAAQGDTLLHFDTRADNLLLTPDRRSTWSTGRTLGSGRPWVDVVFFAPSVAMQGGPAPEELLARSRPPAPPTLTPSRRSSRRSPGTSPSSRCCRRRPASRPCASSRRPRARSRGAGLTSGPVSRNRRHPAVGPASSRDSGACKRVACGRRIRRGPGRGPGVAADPGAPPVPHPDRRRRHRPAAVLANRLSARGDRSVALIEAGPISGLLTAPTGRPSLPARRSSRPRMSGETWPTPPAIRSRMNAAR